MSSVIIGGYQGRFTVSRESSYGLIPSGIYEWIGLVNDAEPTIKSGNINVRRLGVRDLVNIVKGKRELDFKFTYFMQPSGSGTVGGTSFLKTNNLLPISSGIWPAAADPGMSGSFTTELFFSRIPPNQNAVFYIPGCKIEEATIEMRVGEPTKVTCTAWGQQMFTGSIVSGSIYQSDPGLNPFMWYDGLIQYTPLGGSTQILNNVTDARVRTRESLERVYNIQLNTNVVRVLQERGREIDGELTFNFESFAELNELLNDTYFRLDLVLSASAGATGSFYYCKWTDINYPTKPTDLIAFRAPFTATSGSLS